MPRHYNCVIKQLCMETIAPKSDWIVRIGHTDLNLEYLKDKHVWNRKTIPYRQEVCTCCGVFLCRTPNSTEKSLFNIIEEDPNQCFDYIQKSCVQNESLIIRLAVYLSGKAIDQLWIRIFSKQNVDEQFVERWFSIFFSVFLLRPYTWYSLHLLVKASKMYPVQFKSTIKILLKDIYITSTILKDYVEHISFADCDKLMKLVSSEISLTPVEFAHILPVLYVMYKKSEKTSNISEYILSNLESASELCSYNVSYGRLLLYYMQNNILQPYLRFNRLINNHFTSYKNICAGILAKLDEERMGLQRELFDGLEIVLPIEMEEPGMSY